MANLAVRIAFASALALAILLVGCSDFGGGFAQSADGGGVEIVDGTPAVSTRDDGSGGQGSPSHDASSASADASGGGSDVTSGTMTGSGEAGAMDSTVVHPPDAEAGPSPGVPETGSPPEAAAPEAGPMESAAPEASTAEASASEASAPEASAPEASAPEASAHEASAPEGSAPETGSMEAAALEASTAEASVPEASVPDAAAPDSASTEASAPEAGFHDAAAEAEAGGEDLCDPTKVAATTVGCFRQQDKTTTATPDKVCSTCMQTNCFDVVNAGGPGICETVAGNATFFSGALPDGKTCATTFAGLSAPVTEKAVCLATLDEIFKSHCALSLNLTPCLCGATDVNLCLAGNATPVGAVYDVYACDFGSTNGATINDIHNDFQIPTFGAGQANAIAACGTSFGCDCF